MSSLHHFVSLLLSLWKKHWFNHKSFVFQSCTSRYNAGTWGIVQGQLRPLLAPRVYTLPMVRSIGKTMVQGKNYGPQITVKRISTRSVMFRVAARTLKTFFASFSFELEHKNFLNHSFFFPLFCPVFSEEGSVSPYLCRSPGRLWN